MHDNLEPETPQVSWSLPLLQSTLNHFNEHVPNDQPPHSSGARGAGLSPSRKKSGRPVRRDPIRMALAVRKPV
jgi:hypothetical protein